MDTKPRQNKELSVVFEGSVFSVLSGRVRRPAGEWAAVDVVTHTGGVVVIPLLPDEVVLVRQFRPVIGQWLLELPAGRLETPDEDPQKRAAAELAEEVGYRAGRWEQVAVFYTSPGYSDERLIVFLAQELEDIGASPEESEDVELVLLPLSELRKLLGSSEFQDAKTIIGLQILVNYLEKRIE
jgi:ADP-ribose pyrophosphatase